MAEASLDAVFSFIDAHADDAVAELQTLLRQPGISAQNVGPEPERQLEKLKRHLQDHGYGDFEVIGHTARKNPYETPAREATSQATVRAAERVFGTVPLVQGASIQGIIMLSVPPPAVLSGFGAPENNLHAPNENMPVKRFIQGIKYAAAIMHEYAKEPDKEKR